MLDHRFPPRFFLAFVFATVLISACEELNAPTIYFQVPIEGKRASRATGTYISPSKANPERLDTLSILEPQKGTFQIVRNQRDTLYRGGLIRKRNLYFAHEEALDSLWRISCFRIRGDSITNLDFSYRDLYFAIANDPSILMNQRSQPATLPDSGSYLVNGNERIIVKAFRNLMNQTPVSGWRMPESTINQVEEEEESILPEDQIVVEFKIYPNPFSNFITIKQQKEAPITVTATSASTGMELNKSITTTEASWDLSQLPNGLVAIRIFDENGSLIATRKLIKS